MNNREIAAIVWLGGFFLVSMLRSQVRSSVASIFQTFWGRLTVLFLLWVGWVLLEVATLAHIGVWEAEHIKDTVVWFVTSGLVLFGAFTDVSREDRFLRRRAIKAVGIGVFLEAFVNLFVLNLIAELLIVPVSVLVVGVTIVAEQDPAHAQVKRFAEWLLSTFGLVMLAFATVQLISNWSQLEPSDLAVQILLPIVLTIGALPFIYVVGVYATYEIAFKRIDHNSEATPWHVRLRAKAALVVAFHLRGRRLGRFTGPYQVELRRVSGFREARTVIARARAEIHVREEEERAAADRLVRYAGVEGDDEQGRRLDRREFVETRSALRFLATCMWGWYRQEPQGRYKSDLVERFGEHFFCKNLPQPAGLELRIDRSGQNWMAWRQTISGWCFAVGGAGEPPNEWHFDGHEPPKTFPPGRNWYDSSALDESPNWRVDDR